MQGARSVCRRRQGLASIGWSVTAVVIAGLMSAGEVPAQTEAPAPETRPSVLDTDPMQPEVDGVTVVEKLGDKIPADLVFTDEHGQRVQLGDFFQDGRPVILTLNYYRCPMLCTLMLNGVAEAVRDLDFAPGEDYHLLTVSIDPAEGASLARMKQHAYVDLTDDERFYDGWSFLTGEKQSIDALSEAVGVGYEWVEAEKQYAHPAVITVLTPDGTVSRYLYGIKFDNRTLRLSLVEASEGTIGTTMDRFLLTCFHFNPDTGRYSTMAMGVMRLGGMLTIGAMGLSIGGLLLWEFNRRHALGARHGQ